MLDGIVQEVPKHRRQETVRPHVHVGNAVPKFDRRVAERFSSAVDLGSERLGEGDGFQRESGLAGDRPCEVA